MRYLVLLAAALMASTAFAQAGAQTATSAPAPAAGRAGMQAMDMDGMEAFADVGDMEGMSAHMHMTAARTVSAGDAARAQEILDTLRAVLPQYKDYHAAVAAGYQPFMVTLAELANEEPPTGKPALVHFTNALFGLESAMRFDAAHPPALLYRHLGKGKLELVGAMYTAPYRFSEDQLDQRVPLSVAHWHQHINLCVPPPEERKNADLTKFGPDGSIVTRAACIAAGGTFYPRLFGWMVHVYAFETDSGKIWAH